MRGRDGARVGDKVAWSRRGRTGRRAPTGEEANSKRMRRGSARRHGSSSRRRGRCELGWKPVTVMGLHDKCGGEGAQGGRWLWSRSWPVASV